MTNGEARGNSPKNIELCGHMVHDLMNIYLRFPVTKAFSHTDKPAALCLLAERSRRLDNTPTKIKHAQTARTG